MQALETGSQEYFSNLSLFSRGIFTEFAALEWPIRDDWLRLVDCAYRRRGRTLLHVLPDTGKSNVIADTPGLPPLIPHSVDTEIRIPMRERKLTALPRYTQVVNCLTFLKETGELPK